MPIKRFVQIQLPMNQPDRCADCPLLGIVPPELRIRNSQETLVCLGTGEAMTKKGSRVRKSGRDAKHPLTRGCDSLWPLWVTYPRQEFPVLVERYIRCIQPYRNTLEQFIHFHRNTKNTDLKASDNDDNDNDENEELPSEG